MQCPCQRTLRPLGTRFGSLRVGLIFVALCLVTPFALAEDKSLAQETPETKAQEMAAHGHLSSGLVSRDADAPSKPNSSPDSSYRCMADHLREARAINQERMPQYLALTDGASRWISWILIGSESTGIPFANWLEELNAPLAEAGVNILCEDFVSMAHTPPFRSQSLDTPLPLDQFAADRGWDEFSDFWDLGRSRSYAKLARSTDVVLAELTLVPTYHCMYRHILESIRLAAANADKQLSRARAVGLGREAEKLVDLLVTSQVGVLPLATFLDKLAAPLNARGIPIICQDVPPIGNKGS